jgi:PAS domain S-box-containing protein
MLNNLRFWLFPNNNEEEKSLVRRSLAVILPTSMAVGLLYSFFFSSLYPGDWRIWLILAVIFFSIICWGLAQKGYLRSSVLLYALSLWLIMSVAIYHSGGMQSAGRDGFLLIIFVAGLLLGGRYAFLLAILSVASMSWIVYREINGFLPVAPAQDAMSRWGIFLVYVLIGWVLLAQTMKSLRRALRRSSDQLNERLAAEQVLREQAEYLAALHETTLAVINRLDIDSLLESVLAHAESLANTRHGFIDLMLPEGKASREHLGHEVFLEFIGRVMLEGQGITGLALQQGETIIVEDYNTWPGREPDYQNHGFYTTIAIPLKVQGRVIGILGLAYDNLVQHFEKSQIQKLEQFAELASLALDNASLYQNVQSELVERKRTEADLRNSQVRLDLALASAQMGIWDWDIKSNRIIWSEQVYLIFDVEKDKFSNMMSEYFEIIHPADRQRVERNINECVSGAKPEYHIEHRLLSRNGSIRWLEADGRLFTDENGIPVRMAGTVIDITNRKKSEQAIWKANNNLKHNAAALERRSGLLQLGANVARAATAILDSRELSQQVVELVQKQFDLYYVGLFLVEENPHWAILRAATGEAGVTMLKNGHRLEVGNSSMIGWAIANCEARIALDVGKDAVRFYNSLLPETRSEMALPLVSRGEVLGSLTIQSRKQAAFSKEDIATFETMADLLANAILNARLYDQVQRELDERKRAEKKIRQMNVELEARVQRRTAALKASEEKFRALSENNPLQITRYDRNGRYLYVNHLGNLGNLKPENIIGKSLREVFGEHETIYFAESCIRQVFDSGEPLKTEYELLNSVVYWSLAPEFGPDGNVVSVISTTLDISERKRIEEALTQRSAELQIANRELEAFSYSVSHDLRAPLRAIDGFTRILMEDFLGQFPQDAVVFLERTRRAAKDMSQLIDDLLRLSRITRAELHDQEVNLFDLATEIQAELNLREPGRVIQFRINDKLNTRGDLRLLRVALENLISNSWKFTTKTANPLIEIGEISNQSQKTFYVRDNGVGFNMNYADKLFGAFQRLHSTEEFPGTGIGLAIVQRIIHRHGGRIWAESEPNKGATFYFTLD